MSAQPGAARTAIKALGWPSRVMPGGGIGGPPQAPAAGSSAPPTRSPLQAARAPRDDDGIRALPAPSPPNPFTGRAYAGCVGLSTAGEVARLVSEQGRLHWKGIFSQQYRSITAVYEPEHEQWLIAAALQQGAARQRRRSSQRRTRSASSSGRQEARTGTSRNRGRSRGPAGEPSEGAASTISAASWHQVDTASLGPSTIPTERSTGTFGAHDEQSGASVSSNFEDSAQPRGPPTPLGLEDRATRTPAKPDEHVSVQLDVPHMAMNASDTTPVTSQVQYDVEDGYDALADVGRSHFGSIGVPQPVFVPTSIVPTSIGRSLPPPPVAPAPNALVAAAQQGLGGAALAAEGFGFTLRNSISSPQENVQSTKIRVFPQTTLV